MKEVWRVKCYEVYTGRNKYVPKMILESRCETVEEARNLYDKINLEDFYTENMRYKPEEVKSIAYQMELHDPSGEIVCFKTYNF